jgi:hypothetical protein
LASEAQRKAVHVGLQGAEERFQTLSKNELLCQNWYNSWMDVEEPEGSRLRSSSRHDLAKHARVGLHPPFKAATLLPPPVPEDPTGERGIECAIDRSVTYAAIATRVATRVKGEHCKKSVFHCSDLGEWQLLVKQVAQTENEKSVFMMQGGFHHELAMIQSINRYMEGNGMKELLIKAGIFNGNTSATKALGGKHYYNAITALGLLYEVLQHRMVGAHISSVSSEDNADIMDLLTEIRDSMGEGGTEAMDAFNSEEVTSYRDSLRAWASAQAERGGKSAQFKHHLHVLTMIEQLFQFRIAVRHTPDALVGLAGFVSALKPFTKLYDWANRTQYQKATPLVIEMLVGSKHTHPDLWPAIEDGTLLAVCSIAFPNQYLSHDFHLEKFSNYNTAMQKYLTKILSRTPALIAGMVNIPDVNKYCTGLDAITGTKKAATRKKTTLHGVTFPYFRSRREGACARSLFFLTSGVAIAPDDGGDVDGGARHVLEFAELFPVEPASATESAATSIVWGLMDGKQPTSEEVATALVQYPDSQAVPSNQAELQKRMNENRPIWGPGITNPAILNMASSLEKKRRKVKSASDQALQTALGVFSNNSDLPVSEQVSFKDMAPYELASYVPCFENSSGTPNKCNKSAFVTALAGSKPPLLNGFDVASAGGGAHVLVVDGMMILQRVSGGFASTRLVGGVDEAIKMALRSAKRETASRAFLVWDRYDVPTPPLKTAEVASRSKKMGGAVYASISSETRGVSKHEWSRVLSVRRNKQHLTALVRSRVRVVLSENREMFSGIAVSILVGGECFHQPPATAPTTPASPTIALQPMVKLSEFTTPFAEADHQILAVTNKLLQDEGTSRVTVWVDDTDVFVGLLGWSSEMIQSASQELGVLRGVSNKRKRIDLCQVGLNVRKLLGWGQRHL